MTNLGPDNRMTAEPPLHPADALLEAIVCFLTPLLVGGCSGDAGRARLGAIDTVAAYQARNRSELVKIGQIIGFGLMAMDNLRLSMTPDLPLSMVLRLRGGANALNRSAQQNTRALEKGRRGDRPSPGAEAPAALPASDDHDISEADIEASIQRARDMVADARSRMQAEERAEAMAAKAQPVAARPVVNLPAAAVALPAERQSAVRVEQRRKLLWADAMGDVARELSGNRANVPAAQGRSDRIWAEVLSSSASSLALAAGSVAPGENIGIERTGTWSKPG
jgi:hypothetical protein